MRDPRYTQLADILLNYSISVKTKEHIWIKVTSPLGLPLAREVYRLGVQLGAFMYLDIGDDTMSSHFLKLAHEHHLTDEPAIEKFLANWADKCVTIVADSNTRELANADHQKMLLRSKAVKPIRDITINKPWVLTYFPTPAMAQDANMSLEDFTDYYFEACIRDWKKEQSFLTKFAKKLNNAKLIEVHGDKTNLRLSAAGRLFVPCYGTHNMPDGEVFTAPVDDSVEGEVYFNYPLLRQGKMIRDITLQFKKGVVVKASATQNEAYLLNILDTDPGARRLGEFAIGTNQGVQTYMYNVLFDEKMLGTVHMALGEAYEECKGVNKSAIHMDIVKDMTSAGSEVLVDGQAVLREGKLLVE